MSIRPTAGREVRWNLTAGRGATRAEQRNAGAGGGDPPVRSPGDVARLPDSRSAEPAAVIAASGGGQVTRELAARGPGPGHRTGAALHRDGDWAAGEPIQRRIVAGLS